MPTTRRRINRDRKLTNGITEADFIFFTWGLLLDGLDSDWETRPESEQKAFWMQHKEAILSKFYSDERNKNRLPYGLQKWG